MTASATGGSPADQVPERDRGRAQEPDRDDERDEARDLDRDRDLAGRPRNARPRDGLGRPLPRGTAGVPVTPDDLDVTPGEAVLMAQQLIDDGRPFHAHEVLEATWKAAPPSQRDLWQGLAQIAVGLTHARRGNSSGAVTLLRRGADRVAGYGDDGPAGGSARGPAGVPPGGLAGEPARELAGEPARELAGEPELAGLPAELDAPRACAAARELAERITSSGLNSIAADDLRIPLSRD